MLEKQIPGVKPDETLANNGVCGECMALPFTERKKLADKAIKGELDEHRRDLMKDALKKREN